MKRSALLMITIIILTQQICRCQGRGGSYEILQLKSLQNDINAKSVHSFMIESSYRSFITRSNNKVLSISRYLDKEVQHYKIFYYGSSNNIMMCLVSLNITNKQISLQSFVSINRNRVVQQCINYDAQMKCQQCQNSYHLNGNKCRPVIYNCLRYYENICVQCQGYSLLIQNRCVSNCGYQEDCKVILFYYPLWAKAR